nr:MAG TPA: hypothetical protein [Caudoviricetes sp.]
MGTCRVNPLHLLYVDVYPLANQIRWIDGMFPGDLLETSFSLIVYPDLQVTCFVFVQFYHALCKKDSML